MFLLMAIKMVGVFRIGLIKQGLNWSQSWEYGVKSLLLPSVKIFQSTENRMTTSDFPLAALQIYLFFCLCFRAELMPKVPSPF